jgi:hypothetical protein
MPVWLTMISTVSPALAANDCNQFEFEIYGPSHFTDTKSADKTPANGDGRWRHLRSIKAV